MLSNGCFRHFLFTRKLSLMSAATRGVSTSFLNKHRHILAPKTFGIYIYIQNKNSNRADSVTQASQTAPD
jgi:hypothetical protein